MVIFLTISSPVSAPPKPLHLQHNSTSHNNNNSHGMPNNMENPRRYSTLENYTYIVLTIIQCEESILAQYITRNE